MEGELSDPAWKHSKSALKLVGTSLNISYPSMDIHWQHHSPGEDTRQVLGTWLQRFAPTLPPHRLHVCILARE